MKSFKQMIADKEIKRADMMKVQLEDIHEEPGFNLRDETGVDADGVTFQDGIDALAEHMADGGVYPPLEVRPRADGGVFVVDGHRRRRALLQLDAAGRLPRTPNKEDPSKLEAWVAVVAFEGNDADRVARIISSQQNRKLTPLEVARGYKRLAAFGWTPDQIARKFGKTPQHVAQLLTLANANTDVHRMVSDGTVSAAVAVDLVRKHGDDAGKVLTGEAEKAKAQGKRKVTAGTIKGKGISREQVNGLWDSVDAVLDEIDTEARVALESANDNETPVSITLPAWALRDLMNVHGGIKAAKDAEAQRVRDAQAKAAQQEIAA